MTIGQIVAYTQTFKIDQSYCHFFLIWLLILLFYQLTHKHTFGTLCYLDLPNQKVIQSQTYYWIILACFCEVKLEKVDNNFTHARYNFELTHSTYIQSFSSKRSAFPLSSRFPVYIRLKIFFKVIYHNSTRKWKCKHLSRRTKTCYMTFVKSWNSW